jgi:hypothetical protein
MVLTMPNLYFRSAGEKESSNSSHPNARKSFISVMPLQVAHAGYFAQGQSSLAEEIQLRSQ